ncbi:MAG TPA: hypothetical protein VK455_04805 [Thermoplasmata archaeon]|nr:hypothetical protein [Thermoplasmata archaeon]
MIGLGGRWSTTVGVVLLIGLLMVSTAVSVIGTTAGGQPAARVGPASVLATAGGHEPSYAGVQSTQVHPFFRTCSPQCNISIAPSGLPGGSTYTVGVSNQPPVQTSNATASFALANGTYSYIIAGPAGYRAANGSATGNFTVSGANMTLAIDFVGGTTYPLSFHEAGLRPGSAWSVLLAASLRLSSVSGTANLRNLTPGNYTYSLDPILGYIAALTVGGHSIPSSGVLGIASAGVVIHVRFTAITYAITFVEQGLPPGAHWRVQIKSFVISHCPPNCNATRVVQSQSSNSTSVTFHLANASSGALVYVAKGPHGFVVPGPANGTPLVIAGSDRVINLTFVQLVGTAIFNETGLTPGTTWTVSLNGTVFGWTNLTRSSNVSSISFSGVPLGHYTAVPGPSVGFHPPHSHPFNLLKPNQTITWNFYFRTCGSNCDAPVEGFESLGSVGVGLPATSSPPTAIPTMAGSIAYRARLS